MRPAPRTPRRGVVSAREAEEQARKAHQAEQDRIAGQSRLQGNMARRRAEILARQARRRGAAS